MPVTLWEDEEFEWACFASHQAAEKALRALYQAAGEEAWGHSVFALLENLKQVVGALAPRRQEVKRVILFGSLATGRAVPASDADLLYILSESDRPFLARIPLYVPEGCSVGVDVFPYTEAEFEEMRASQNPFFLRALAQGIEIYPL